MEKENVIEICMGIGLNQLFPETIKIVVEESPKINMEPIDTDKYYYY